VRGATLLATLAEFIRSNHKELTRFIKFAIVGTIGAVVDFSILNLMVNLATLFGRFIPDPFDYNLAKAIAIIIVLFWNFGINRIWTYRGIK
jgi:putative flippase GtrA